MALLFAVLRPLERFNTFVLMIGRWLAMGLLVLMVCFILGQVILRYGFDAAPNWTEEGARFGMLWLTGLMAPTAYRRGGFVSIDMLERALPRTVSAVFTLVLLGISLWVLVVMLDRGIYNHVFSLSGNGNSPALRLPLDWIGGERIRFKLNWAYASLAVGIALLILVNIELVLRQIITLFGCGNDLNSLVDASMIRAD
jgi:TRAP-type C4-dicarboxylate transport system permease small subunit